MPHKRAKKSVREKTRTEHGQDLAPSKQSLSNEAIPKSLARVLNAAHIREEWRAKKRKLEEDDDRERNGKRKKLSGATKGNGKEEHVKSQLRIKPGESIQHFNRRVEDDMRYLVKSAVQTSNAVSRSARKAEIEEKAKRQRKNMPTAESEDEDQEKAKPKRKAPPSIPAPATDKHADSPKEFQKLSSSAPRRLNDIAQAPPEFKKLPRGAAAALESAFGGTGLGKRDGILSMAQKTMMEKEREKAITRYREMKANRRKAGDVEGERERDVVEGG
ncbi:hypothetical protein BDZ94DRAFT_1253239 [Collybia nuda]|uniref:Uncharacterized protein n=1 Tax=Collybia nuda TaxID=64659 RepID=A0A9P5YBV0_9AGAR|nr:hypothetical protein BDZ94DRAFT_1253239 [Collybia nuda]